MSRRFSVPCLPLVLALGLAPAGCQGDRGAQGSQDPTLVSVSQPLEREVTDFGYFNAKVQAGESVEIRAQVSGYLAKVLFDPGADVKKGEVLFEIDRRTFEAELKVAEGEVTRTLAREKAAEYE